jgi:hypothetical protein
MKLILLILFTINIVFSQDSTKTDTLVKIVLLKQSDGLVIMYYEENAKVFSQETIRTFLLLHLKELYLKPKIVIVPKDMK